jgi:hypothetical protein
VSVHRTFVVGFFLAAVVCLAQHNSSGIGTAVPYSPSIGTGRNVAPPSRGAGYHRYRGPAAYPVYIGPYAYGGYNSGYDPGYAPSADAAPAPPPVIINQYFGAPPGDAAAAEPQPDEQSLRIYPPPVRPAAEPEQAPDPRTYLIAYKDHSVYTALAYWIEDHTLHYVTTANTHNQADLSLIDIDFTKKLNQDRNMPFTVPGAAH